MVISDQYLRERDGHEDTICRLMLWFFTDYVHSECRMMLGHCVDRITMSQDHSRIIMNAFNLVVNDLVLHKETDHSVYSISIGMGCKKEYMDKNFDDPIFLISDVKNSLEFLIGEEIELPDVEYIEERKAIAEFDG